MGSPPLLPPARARAHTHTRARTSAPGLGSVPQHLHRVGGSPPPTSAPRLGSPLPHLRRDWARLFDICPQCSTARGDRMGVCALSPLQAEMRTRPLAKWIQKSRGHRQNAPLNGEKGVPFIAKGAPFRVKHRALIPGPIIVTRRPRSFSCVVPCALHAAARCVLRCAGACKS
jgi:hypothetical protein